MHYSNLLFDADDTLFDFQITQEKSLMAVFEIIGLPKSAKQDYLEISHRLWQQLEKQEITLDKLKQTRFTALLARYPDISCQWDVEELYEKHLASHAELINGAKELLETLSQKHNLYLISNGMPHITRPRLEKSGIISYFKGVFISEEIGAQKPSPAFFDYVFQTIQAPKSQCLVIGDSLTSDISGGHNYGLDTCYLNFDKKISPLPTYCISSYKELIDLLK